jgi:hypothetical protein
MEAIVRTITGAELQTCQLLGIKSPLRPYTTLNEKFKIAETVAIADTDRSSIKYIGIGNGGHRMVIGTNGIAKPEPVQHTPRDSALYNQLPFVLRLQANDLSPTERAQYRLRRLETHDGQLYAAYYLKVLDLTGTQPKLEIRSVKDGMTVSLPFEHTASDLNPIPPAISSTGVLTTTGDYIAATAKVPFIMSALDIEEFLNVCNVIYGDPNYAMISEIALVAGIDRVTSGDFSGVSVAYTESIQAQIISFISSFYSLAFNTDGLTLNFDVGNLEPLLNIR